MATEGALCPQDRATASSKQCYLLARLRFSKGPHSEGVLHVAGSCAGSSRSTSRKALLRPEAVLCHLVRFQGMYFSTLPRAAVAGSCTEPSRSYSRNGTPLSSCHLSFGASTIPPGGRHGSSAFVCPAAHNRAQGPHIAELAKRPHSGMAS